jgi:hypothetical protein
LVLVFIAASACGPAPSWSVQRVDVTLGVRPNGTIDVRETIAVRFSEPDTARFERRVALERADSLTFESASIDGTQIQPGSYGDASLQVDDDRGLRVVWMFPPSPEATRVFEVVYRANGAVAVRGIRGTIRHVAVPGGRTYGIESAAVRLAVDPDLHRFDGAGIAEAGWTVSRTSDGIAGERRSLAPNDSATVMAEVGIDPAAIAEPSWQRYEDWTRDLIPAFVSGGLFILVIGGGVLWIVRFQYPRRKRGASPLTDVEDRERIAVRAGLRTSGYVTVVLSGVLAVVTWLTLSHFGWWPMSLPASILIVGLVFLAVNRRFV